MKLVARLVAGCLTVSALAPLSAQDLAAAGAQAFGVCKACHVIKKGAPSGVGPNLYGVVGRPAASLSGYNYSPALKASKLVWDEATLSDYLAGPMKKVPGTKMPIATADPAKRAALIAYLKAEGSK